MNIQALHQKGKGVSLVSVFKGKEGTVTALQLLTDQQLKKHSSKVPAVLICVRGEVVFENEHGLAETLKPGDYINIEPMVEHWVNGILDSHLLLVK